MPEASRGKGERQRTWLGPFRQFRIAYAFPLVLAAFTMAAGLTALFLTEQAFQREKGVRQSAASALFGKVVVGIFGLGAALAGGAMSVSALRPLRSMTERARELTLAEVAPREGKPPHDEVRELANAFERMTLSLDRYVSDSYILNQLPEGLITFDREGHVNTANSIAIQMLGEALLCPKEKEIHYKDLLLGTEGNEKLIDAIERGLRNRSHPLRESCTGTFRNPEGGPLQIRAEMFTPRDLPSREDKAAVVIAFKSLEEHYRIREDIRRLDQLALLGSISAGLAHEIRNPLGHISGMAELIQEDLPEGDRKRQYAQEVVKATHRLKELVSSLLDLAALSTVSLEPTDVNQVCAEATAWSEAEAREKGVRLHSDLAERLPLVHASAEKLAQAFLNILRNAVQATPREGQVSASTRALAEGGVELRFANTGSYIPPEERARIFEPFVAGKKGGAGLGLFLARQIVLAHGGKVAVESAPEGQTAFIVTLPPADRRTED